MLVGGFSGPVAVHAHQVQDDRMVYDAIDGRHRRHRIFENAVPVGKHQICRNGHAAAFVTFAQERKEHLHFVTVVLDVADVVEEDTVETVELGQGVWQAQIALGGQ